MIANVRSSAMLFFTSLSVQHCFALLRIATVFSPCASFCFLSSVADTANRLSSTACLRVRRYQIPRRRMRTLGPQIKAKASFSHCSVATLVSFFLRLDTRSCPCAGPSSSSWCLFEVVEVIDSSSAMTPCSAMTNGFCFRSSAVRLVTSAWSALTICCISSDVPVQLPWTCAE